MEFRRWIIGVALAFFLTPSLYAMTESQATVASQTIQIYFPQKYQPQRRYPFILALGDRRQGPLATAAIWGPIAHSLNYILVCVDDTAAPKTLDRKGVVAIRDYMDRTYRVDASTAIVVGIGKAGNLAIEAAMLAPRNIRNVMAFYAHFDPEWETVLRKNVRKEDYKYSSMAFITSEGDPSQNSLTRLSDVLFDLGIETELIVYPKVQMGYPDDLQTIVSRICVKVAENVSKENRR